MTNRNRKHNDPKIPEMELLQLTPEIVRQIEQLLEKNANVLEKVMQSYETSIGDETAPEESQFVAA